VPSYKYDINFDATAEGEKLDEFKPDYMSQALAGQWV
jgi:hypothetical protein